MFDYVLMDCLDKGVIRHRLDENRAVIVARCCSDINLECQPSILLQHSVMDVLNVKRELKVGAPVVSVVAIVREDRIVEEYAKPIEVGAQSIEHNDVRRDDQEIPRKSRVRFI